MNLNQPFFIGIAGSGMSALAQYLAMSGHRVSGSDRAFDRDKNHETLARYKKLGITVSPQDGSGITSDISCLVHSTAI